jgi:hypothetical protein
MSSYEDLDPSRGSDRDRIFLDPRRSEYLWCLHCQRTYEHHKWRTIEGLQRCPYVDCDRDAVIDAIDWAVIRDTNPDYPEKPEWGKTYLWERHGA